MNTSSGDAKIGDGHNPEDTQNLRASGLARVKDLVRRFRVCWEMYPEQVMVKSEIRKVGFALELYGTHEPGTGHVDPGCDHCRKVQSSLREIAGWILPREERPSMYDVSVDTQALSYSPEQGNRPDVCVTIRILHRSDFEKPIDECEMRCLKEMQRALAEVGACKSVWRPSIQAQPNE